MNSKDCLKHICDECQKNAGKIQVACPFRSISNEYCDKYETIKQDLEILEILKKNITIEKYYAYEILEINLTSIEEDFKKVKEWLKSE